ncbi:MAG: VOC family protein [Chloroflexi bacterium]|nr:MAG: VOC family protein [Chloroflexota bacterium]TMD82540.1 MAG: VOC family protein [Chloroflexota bacterium]
MATGVQVVFDCSDPARMASFWAAALHYKLQDPPPGFDSWPAWLKAQGIPESEWNSASAVVDPEGRGPRIYFQRVPEGKVVKNRVHLDLNVGGPRTAPPEERRRGIDAEVDRLVALQARKVKALEERGEYFVNMLDPEGNEFDVQ